MQEPTSKREKQFYNRKSKFAYVGPANIDHLNIGKEHLDRFKKHPKFKTVDDVVKDAKDRLVQDQEAQNDDTIDGKPTVKETLEKLDKGEPVDRTFVNWARTSQSSPRAIFYPRTIDDVQLVIRRAAKENRRVRAVGHAHSWTPLFADDDSYLIVNRGLKKITVHKNGDPNSDWLLQIECGANTGEVKAFMNENGVCLPANVILDKVQYGGTVITGCHGTGWNEKTLSDLVEEMRIVNAAGELVTYSRKTHNHDMMNAVRMNMGLFGFVIDMKLRVLPIFNVRVKNIKVNMDEYFADNCKKLKEATEKVYAMEVFWFPFCDQIWLKSFEKTDEEVDTGPVEMVWDTIQSWIRVHTGQSGLDLVHSIPGFTEAFMQTGFKILPEDTHVQTLNDAIHYQKFLDDIHVQDMEFCFGFKDNDWSNVKKAWMTVVNLVNEYAKRKLYPMNVALEMRFLTGSEAWLSPAFGNTRSCYMEILTGLDTPGWEPFFFDVARGWMDIPDSRPHWAKWMQGVPEIQRYCRKVYGKNFKTFLEQLKESNADPKGLFWNKWLEYMLKEEINDDNPWSRTISVVPRAGKPWVIPLIVLVVAVLLYILYDKFKEEIHRLL